MILSLLAAAVVVASGARNFRHDNQAIGPARAVVYATDVHTPLSAIATSSLVGVNSGSGSDFNPALLAGVRGFPGIKLRLNYRAFQYASSVIGGAIDGEIKRARIPPIMQCLPQVNGCINIYNLYVSRYRCAQMVTIYPLPPNRIGLSVQNLDIGISGNLGGQITILLPLPLTGIVHMNAHQVSINVQLTVVRSQTGTPMLQVVGCSATIGYVDTYVENGGLIGEIMNNQFRSKVSEQVRAMIPGRLCGMLPQILNERLNSRLAGMIPSSIPFSKIASMASGLFGQSAPKTTPAYCYTPACLAKSAAHSTTPSSHSVNSVGKPISPPPLNPPNPSFVSPNSRTPRYSTSNVASGVVSDTRPSHPVVFSGVPLKAHSLSHTSLQRTPYRRSASPVVWQQKRNLPTVPDNFRRTKHHVNAAPRGIVQRPIPSRRLIRTKVVRVRAVPTMVGWPQQQQQYYRQQLPNQALQQYQQQRQYYQQQGQYYQQHWQLPVAMNSPIRSLRSNHARAASTVSLDEQQCVGCPGVPSKDDPLGTLQDFLKDLDLNKLSDLYLTTQILNTYATANDFTVDLTGEFIGAPNVMAPFGAFPMFFPSPTGNRMAEVLISDFTLNSLFYLIHRKGFITFRVGPETPKIGDLLKTTCSDEEEDEELEDHGVEVDEEEEGTTGGVTVTTAATTARRHRVKRAEDGASEGGLADLGICFGDIMPAIREKYPNRRLYIIVRTTRAPSVILSASNGGTATVDLMADADIYIQETNEKVGTISITAVVDVVVQSSGNRITGTAEMKVLKLADHQSTLGLPQDALDNLANLGKEMLAKVANDALAKGITLELPTSDLPVSFVQPQVQVTEHAIYLTSDVALSPSLLASFQTGGCRRLHR